MTRLIVLLGVACLIGFCIAWPPAALLFAGLIFLWLAAVRTSNQRRGGQQ